MSEEKNIHGEEMSRRVFLRSVMWGSVGLTALMGGIQGFSVLFPRKIEGFGAVINVGNIKKFPPNSITRVRDGRMYISRLGEDRIMALYWKCPHLGCTVPWVPVEGLFVCPCHGSKYTRTGQNVAGPAPRPMDYMNVMIQEDGTVLVDTGDIRERSEHSPSHETRIPPEVLAEDDESANGNG